MVRLGSGTWEAATVSRSSKGIQPPHGVWKCRVMFLPQEALMERVVYGAFSAANAFKHYAVIPGKFSLCL